MNLLVYRIVCGVLFLVTGGLYLYGEMTHHVRLCFVSAAFALVMAILFSYPAIFFYAFSFFWR